MLYQDLLDKIVNQCKKILGKELIGVYLHGSMAMGCFNPDKSDIDLIVIIEENISDAQKLEFMKRIVELNGKAPAKGLEVSIVKRKYCSPFRYPTPFELHFSPVHLKWFHVAPQNYVENMKGEDKDLAAHFTMIHKYGIVLYGEAIENIFASVPRENYMDSIYADIENAEKDIMEEPMYITLNLCRVLAFLRDGLYLSKEEGGKWGIRNLPAEYQPIILGATECYATERKMGVDEEAAYMFAQKMIKLIKQEMRY